MLVDGDDTYDAAASTALVSSLVEERLDFINGMRISTAKDAYRAGHRFGNWLLTGPVRQIFGRQFNDMLSCYKILSRRFVKSFPAMSSGFETETELAVHALELRMPCSEVATAYKERPPGSVSKLRTYSDGAQIMMLIARLVKDERPLYFFGLSGLAAIILAVLLSVPLLVTYFETGLVPRVPTAILSVALVIVGVISVFTGLILDMTTKTRREMKRLIYLSLPAISVSTPTVGTIWQEPIRLLHFSVGGVGGFFVHACERDAPHAALMTGQAIGKAQDFVEIDFFGALLPGKQRFSLSTFGGQCHAKIRTLADRPTDRSPSNQRRHRGLRRRPHRHQPRQG